MRPAGAALLACLVLAAPARAAERLPQLTPEQMTPAQKQVSDKIMGSRRSLSGPFSAWLRSPELADRFQAVGEYLRFSGALPKPLREFAIMITAREWTSQLEWQLHYKEAVTAGIKPEILAALAKGERPVGMSADETLVYDFSTAMHRDRGRVSDALFEGVRGRFGEQGAVDLIGLNAYYDAVSMTINAAQVPLPAGVEPPLKPLR